MFNKEQREHMRDLASIPREKRCECGWYLKGDCQRCSDARKVAHKQMNQAESKDDQ